MGYVCIGSVIVKTLTMNSDKRCLHDGGYGL